MLENVFIGSDTQTNLSSLKNRFYTTIPIIRTDIMSSLKQKGMYSVDPESAGAYSVGGALLSVAPFVLLQITKIADIFSSIPLVFVCGLISAVIWFLFARVMTAKTLKGVQTKVAVLGFQEFMNRVDKDRLRTMPPDTFEKYLPYAMALGVEHQWATAFTGLIQNPPTWYYSPYGYGLPGGGFNPIFFSNSMSSMSTNMHRLRMEWRRIWRRWRIFWWRFWWRRWKRLLISATSVPALSSNCLQLAAGDTGRKRCW